MIQGRILYSPSGGAGEYADKGLACNIYSGCVHGCRYCYVPSIFRQTREQFHAISQPVKNDPLTRLKQDCKTKHEEPIFFSFTSDIFQPEPYRNITREAIKIVKDSGNSIRILTKGFVPNSIMRMLAPEDEVGVTLTLRYYPELRLWEPSAGDYDCRLANLVRAKNRGIKTWVSFEPVIDPEQTLLIIEDVAPWADVVKIGMSNHTNSWNWPSAEWKQRVQSINWKEFGNRAVELCEQLGLKYCIKADLRKQMEANR